MNRQEKLLNFHIAIQVIALIIGIVLLAMLVIFAVLATVFYLFSDSPTVFWQVTIGCFVGCGIAWLVVIGNMVLLEWRLKRL